MLLNTLYSEEYCNLVPGGNSMYTSYSKSPCRNAFFTLNCCNGQSKFAAKENKTRTMLIFVTGANVSK
ncbi:hypothetical protein LguiB_004388 [Lonicera macranthoides]